MKFSKAEFLSSYIGAYLAGIQLREEEIGEKPGLIPIEERVECAVENAIYNTEAAWIYLKEADNG